jgi:hypothetical protein
MAVYLCRWPNGDFSIVSARSKTEATILLDEWGNAEQAQISRMQECMFDFRLNDEGEIELADTGEATYAHVMEKCFSVALHAMSDAESNEEGGYTEASRRSIREAVRQERTRLWDSQSDPRPATTELGREIQKQTGAAGVLMDRIVKEAGRRILESAKSEEGKPN